MNRTENYVFIIFFSLLIVFGSCKTEDIKVDEEKYDNYILEFALESISNRGVINNIDNSITVASPFKDENEYVAHFSLSDGATSEPKSGSSFGTGNNQITVTSKDGIQRVYDLILEFRNKTALLIIDLQNANFPVYKQQELLANINTLHSKAALSDKAITIFMQHTDSGVWEYGSDTWQIKSEVQPLDNDILLRKITISAMTQEMEDVLNNLGVYKILLTGTLTNLCIAESIIPAYNLGFRIIVPEEAHTTNYENPDKVISDFYITYAEYIEVYTVDKIDF